MNRDPGTCKPDGTPYPYRTEKLREANFAAQKNVFAAAAKAK